MAGEMAPVQWGRGWEMIVKGREKNKAEICEPTEGEDIREE